MCVCAFRQNVPPLCAHPLFLPVIRGLLTRRVAPTPVRRSFTLESDIEPFSVTRLLCRVRLSLIKGFRRSIRWLNESPTSRGLNTQTRNPVDVANSTDVTTLPLLAWRPNDCTSRAIYRRYIFAPRRTPGFSERRRRRRRRRQWRRTRTRKRSPRF